MAQIIQSPVTKYHIDALVGQTTNYNVYIVTADSGEQHLLKIAVTTHHNGLLDREAFLLRDLYEEITRRETEHECTNKPNEDLGYKRCFPRLEESFLVPEQGNRRVNVITIYGAETPRDLVPIEQWRTRERVRIDPKTSAWILGRLLKIFTLTHPFGVSIGKVDGGNILVNPTEHHVAFFDWTQARHHNSQLPPSVAQTEIAAATKQVILALGGNINTGELLDDPQLPDSRYAELLKQLADGRLSDPVSAGVQFYRLVDEMWERGFHPFTTYKL